MKIRLAPLLTLLVLVILGPVTAIPRITIAAQGVDCGAVSAYAAKLHETYDVEAQFDAAGLNVDLLETWTSADFMAASDLMEDLQSRLQQISPPPGAEALHDLLLQRIGATSQMFDSLAAIGIFGALGYMDTLDTLDTEIADAAIALELECNIPILDNDDDGVAEIGSGNPASGAIIRDGSNSVNATGTREDPLPIGTTVRLSEEWEVSVVAVLPDATEFVLAESEYNGPPPIGHQYFVAEVKVSYVGDTSARFSSSRIKAVGQSSVAYEEYQDNCGQLPDELEDREIFGGGSIQGNICWAVSNDDVESLVLFDGDSSDEDRVYLSLEPSSSSDLLVTPTPRLTPTTMATPEEEFQPPAAATPLVVASPEIFATPESISAVEATPKVVVVISSNVITDAIDAAVSSAGTPFVKISPELDAKDIAFVPTEITINAADEPVTIKMKNTGAALHNFSIDSLKIDVDVNPGETVDVVIPAGTAPGTYDFYCNVPGHKEAGMVGTLIVK